MECGLTQIERQFEVGVIPVTIFDTYGKFWETGLKCPKLVMQSIELHILYLMRS